MWKLLFSPNRMIFIPVVKGLFGGVIIAQQEINRYQQQELACTGKVEDPGKGHVESRHSGYGDKNKRSKSKGKNGYIFHFSS